MTEAYQQKSLPQTLTLDHVSPATRLLEKRRQMFEVQEALDAQKEEFARREEAFRRREEGLRKKDLELQEQLIKFNKFLQENEAKRQRAKKRAESEHKAFLAKRAELKEKQQELEELQRKSEELRQTLERNRRYEDYLVRVQEPVREDYPEVADLLNRHRTLRDAFHDLKKQQGEFERRTEETRREYGDYVKQRNTEILNQTNLLDRLKRQLEQTQLGAADLQTKVDRTVARQSEKTLELGQTLMAVDNLLRRCTAKSRGAKGQPQSDTIKVLNSTSDLASKEAQDRVLGRARENLARVRDYITDFSAICSEWQRRETARARSVAGDTASHAGAGTTASPSRGGKGGGAAGGDTSGGGPVAASSASSAALGASSSAGQLSASTSAHASKGQL